MEITIEKVEEFAKNRELKQWAKTLEMEKEFLNKVLKPKVEKIYNDVLKNYSFTETRKSGDGAKITDYDNLWLSEDEENVAKFYKDVNSALRKAGLMNGIEDGYCPRLCKESDIRDIENRIIKMASEAFGIGQIFSLERRQELLQIALKLALN